MIRPTDLTPDDLLAAADTCRATLSPAFGRDWEVRARDLEWTCRRTLDHVADALLLYAAYLATRATTRRPPPRNGDPAASPADLLAAVESSAATLAEVVRAAPSGTRAFHPAGMADATGFVAMGCEENLAHTWDIAEGLGVTFPRRTTSPPASSPLGAGRRATLGRAALGRRPDRPARP